MKDEGLSEMTFLQPELHNCNDYEVKKSMVGMLQFVGPAIKRMFPLIQNEQVS